MLLIHWLQAVPITTLSLCAKNTQVCKRKKERKEKKKKERKEKKKGERRKGGEKR